MNISFQREKKIEKTRRQRENEKNENPTKKKRK